MKRAVVLGSGGFIGAHLVRRLKSEGYWVRGVDLLYPPFAPTAADEYISWDLRSFPNVARAIQGCSEVYQLATAMGGAGYIFTGEHDAYVMHTAAQINLNVLEAARQQDPMPRVFFPSSACVYPQESQTSPAVRPLVEYSAYPANPDSEYGWEKLFAERCYLAYQRNYGLPVRLARFHSIVGPEGTYTGGKEKVFAATCRKVAEAEDGGTIAIWGDGAQTRTFLYIDDCIEAVRRLMASAHTGPVNIGSSELVSINQLIDRITLFAGKVVDVVHTDGPLGVRGRTSDQTLIQQQLGWAPAVSLDQAIAKTYPWVAEQVGKS